jgi:hypothetical protein
LVAERRNQAALGLRIGDAGSRHIVTDAGGAGGILVLRGPWPVVVALLTVSITYPVASSARQTNIDLARR